MDSPHAPAICIKAMCGLFLNTVFSKAYMNRDLGSIN